MDNEPKPLVRICVPVYNSAATLPATLDSILAQTYGELSVCIVDNASTDGSVSIAEGYAARDGRVQVLKHSENVGAEGNFTRCLELADGKYTTIFHSDDIYPPGMVGELVAFLEANPGAGAVFPMARIIGADGVPGRVCRLPPELRREAPVLCDFYEFFRVLLRHANFLFCPGVMARTEVYRDHIRKWDAGGFRTSADLDVWLRIALKYKVGFIDKPLLLYRGAAPTSFSYDALRKRTARHDMLKVFEFYVKGPAAHLMGRAERADYAMQVLKDDINRAFNHFLSGSGAQGRALLGGLFRPANLLSAARLPAHLKTMLYGCAVFALTLLPLPERARLAIARRRFGA